MPMRSPEISDHTRPRNWTRHQTPYWAPRRPLGPKIQLPIMVDSTQRHGQNVIANMIQIGTERAIEYKANTDWLKQYQGASRVAACPTHPNKTVADAMHPASPAMVPLVFSVKTRG